MGILIIAFPESRQKTAGRIEEILTGHGFREIIRVKTGSEALRKMGRLKGGILICPKRLPDLYYTELLEYLPPHFEMLLLSGEKDLNSTPLSGLYTDSIVTVQMPVKVHAFIETVNMMDAASDLHRTERLRRDTGSARDPRDENYIRNAKEVLMQRQHMTEEEAHKYLQKNSMDTGRKLVESAQMILLMEIM
ncbi:MAG: ANTAR domain-containing protein [Eubacterium sp.]|nr:ANTAR domain-containing protein [Eubacterium sp.]